MSSVRQVVLFAAALFAGAAQSQLPTPAQRELREIYKELVEINTPTRRQLHGRGERARRPAQAAGTAVADVRRDRAAGRPQKGNLVARYRGTGAKKPLMLLGHIDVVEAKREDWEGDPVQAGRGERLLLRARRFRRQVDGRLFTAESCSLPARKATARARPDPVATCDEEIVPSKYSGIVYLLKNHRDLIDAEFALNEGGAALLDKSGKYQRMTIQAAERVPDLPARR